MADQLWAIQEKYADRKRAPCSIALQWVASGQMNTIFLQPTFQVTEQDSLIKEIKWLIVVNDHTLALQLEMEPCL